MGVRIAGEMDLWFVHATCRAGIDAIHHVCLPFQALEGGRRTSNLYPDAGQCPIPSHSTRPGPQAVMARLPRLRQREQGTSSRVAAASSNVMSW